MSPIGAWISPSRGAAADAASASSSASSSGCVVASERATPKRARDESGRLRERRRDRRGRPRRRARPTTARRHRARCASASLRRERLERLGFLPGQPELGDLAARCGPCPCARARPAPGRRSAWRDRRPAALPGSASRRRAAWRAGTEDRRRRSPSAQQRQRATDEQRERDDRRATSTWQPAQRPHGPTLDVERGPRNPPV